MITIWYSISQTVEAGAAPFSLLFIIDLVFRAHDFFKSQENDCNTENLTMLIPKLTFFITKQNQYEKMFN